MKINYTETPRYFFFVKGAAEGYTPLNAFDGALIDAGVGNFNLVKVSSIIPPRCTEIRDHSIPPGSLVPIAYASIISDIPGEVISAAVAAALPEDDERPGLIMEYSSRGHKEEIESIVRNMAEQGMAKRGTRIARLQSVAIESKVQHIGAAFAGVMLWY
ncbi:MAG: pyruvoyl-dependent arginine decarboxylase [bacterium]